jgi:hypothetical protein
MQPFLAEQVLTNYDALILAALNVIQLGFSAWNNRKISKVRDEQAQVARALKNGKVVK